VYPRVKDYGNWHQIQFGNIYGYVHKNGTSPATGNEIKNLNTNYKNQSRTFKTLQAVTVYDNTSGKLVPFGSIEKDVDYPIATDYGNWWRIVFADRVGYVRKSEVHIESEVTFKKYNISLQEAVNIQMKANPQTDKRQYAWVHKDYIDKNKNV